jgi:guanylate kinase
VLVSATNRVEVRAWCDDPAAAVAVACEGLGGRPVDAGPEPGVVARRSFGRDGWVVHVDEVAGVGTCVAVCAGSAAEADAVASALGVSEADVLRWPYDHLAAMQAAARGWRERLAGAGDGVGRLVLVDGPSASGKTTLAHALVVEAGLRYVRRHTTRRRRAEADDDEYLFVSAGEFDSLAAAGAFLEYRHFEFGMSYGLAWDVAIPPLLGGLSALGVMNLGGVRWVKRLLPEAVTLLITAPREDLARRLLQRGVNTPEQIEERLGNAAKVDAYRPHYDHVVVNAEGRLDEALAEARAAIAS